ncbi:tRNA-histidine guanylyltransferase 1-like [Sorochytrium milnesiophthora]
MANSKYQYVRGFERNDALLPNTYIVVRIDGKGFHKHIRFTKTYDFEKPNDERALHLANHCATRVLEQVKDICIAYGQSDEYSFVFRRATDLFGRRESKLTTLVVSIFTANYVHAWPQFFPHRALQHLPSFDGRAVLYPAVENVRDYLSWRQADCHINNLYNTTFWALVQQGGMTEHDAQQRLSGTLSGDKNEILFSQFGINYASLPAMFRKGSVVYWREVERTIELLTRTGSRGGTLKRPRETIPEEEHKDWTPVAETVSRTLTDVAVTHCDLIGNDFWTANPGILA